MQTLSASYHNRVVIFLKRGKGEGWGGKGVGGVKGNFPPASVGSRAGGDNRKRAQSARRRIGPKSRPTDGNPAPGSRLSASLPLCVYTLKVIIRSRNFAYAAS